MAYGANFDEVAAELAEFGIDINEFNIIDTIIDPEFIDESENETNRFIKEKASNSQEEFASFLFYNLIYFKSEVWMK